MAVDSFEQLDLESDKLQSLNLQKSRELQTRLASTLSGISSHYHFLQSSSQERKVQNPKIIIQSHLGQDGALLRDKKDSSAVGLGQVHVPVRVKERDQSITTSNSSGRHSNHHQVPKDSISRNNAPTFMSGVNYNSQGSVFEMKKASSQLNVKLKRQSINFIQKEGSSRNSTVRDSLNCIRQDGQKDQGGIQSVLSSRQNPLTSKSIDDKNGSKLTAQRSKSKQLVQNFIDLFRKRCIQRGEHDQKKQLFNVWRSKFLYQRKMRQNGVRMLRSLQIITKISGQFRDKQLWTAFELWKERFAILRFKEQVMVKLAHSLRVLVLKKAFRRLDGLVEGHQSQRSLQSKYQAQQALLRRQPQRQGQPPQVTMDLNKYCTQRGAGGFQTQRVTQKTFYPEGPDSILQELIKENVQKSLLSNHCSSNLQTKTRNCQLAHPASHNSIGQRNSLDKKVTPFSTQPQTLLQSTNSAKKIKAVSTPKGQNKVHLKHAQIKISRNNQGIKHSQSSGGFKTYSSANNKESSDKKNKKQTSASKKNYQSGPSNQQQSLYKMFTTNSNQKQGQSSSRPTSSCQNLHSNFNSTSGIQHNGGSTQNGNPAFQRKNSVVKVSNCDSSANFNSRSRVSNNSKVIQDKSQIRTQASSTKAGEIPPKSCKAMNKHFQSTFSTNALHPHRNQDPDKHKAPAPDREGPAKLKYNNFFEDDLLPQPSNIPGYYTQRNHY